MSCSERPGFRPGTRRVLAWSARSTAGQRAQHLERAQAPEALEVVRQERLDQAQHLARAAHLDERRRPRPPGATAAARARRARRPRARSCRLAARAAVAQQPAARRREQRAAATAPRRSRRSVEPRPVAEQARDLELERERDRRQRRRPAPRATASSARRAGRRARVRLLAPHQPVDQLERRLRVREPREVGERGCRSGRAPRPATAGAGRDRACGRTTKRERDSGSSAKPNRLGERARALGHQLARRPCSRV